MFGGNATAVLSAIITELGLADGEVLSSYDLSGLIGLLGSGYLRDYGLGGETWRSNKNTQRKDGGNWAVGEVATRIKGG
jgi:hypothetical protein